MNCFSSIVSFKFLKILTSALNIKLFLLNVRIFYVKKIWAKLMLQW
jgi:hypothetical protein